MPLRRPVLLLLAVAGLSCGPSAPPARTAASATAAPGAAALARSHALRWVRGSAEYRAVAVETYRAALAAVERASAGRPAGSWAVSVDADETIIDNSQYEVELEEKGETVTDATWRAWVKRRERPAVPGAAAFLEGVRRLGGRVAVVSNTSESLRGDLAANLDSLGLPYDVLLCRPDGGDERKESRWKAVADGTARPGLGPLEILVWVGDNIQDFPGQGQELRRRPESAYAEFGVRWFVIPNPIYGSWEKSPPD